jgi:hypothetical protein
MMIESIPILEQNIRDFSSEIAEQTGVETRLRQQKTRKKQLYVWPSVVAIVFVGVLVWRGWAATPTVAITFDVGGIIGGLLAGVGALAAGIAYAVSRRE